MKIVIVGPGIMPIPPTGWGAVEILIWDQKLALEELGHEVVIVNTPHPMEIIKDINAEAPDFVHIQYDDFIEIYPYIQYPCAITSHFGYLEQPERWDYYGDRIVKPFERIKPLVFCLSSGIRDVYRDKIGIPEEHLFVTPNGVNVDNFRFTISPEFPDRSIYLAKIDFVNVSICSSLLEVYIMLVIMLILDLIQAIIILVNGQRILYILT